MTSRGGLELITNVCNARAEVVDKWLSGATAEAALRAIELHVLPDSEFELRRNAFVQRVVGRHDLAVALRLLGIPISDPPP